MKKSLTVIAIVLLCILACFAGNAQKNAKLDAQGNYVSASVGTTKVADKPTGKYFIDRDGNKYPVMLSARGKLYYIRTAKTSGNEYKVYLKV